MKKMICLVLCLALLPIFAISVIAADKQLTYGSHSLSGEILTDFTDGQICGQASGSGSMSVANGELILVAEANKHVESYAYYKGGNIGSANVKNAKYVCFEIENATAGAVLFNFQGTREDGGAGKNFRTSEHSDLNLLLVDTAGKVYNAELEYSNARLAVKLPASFKGTLLIPTARAASATANQPDWNSGGNLPFRSLGFYIFNKGENGNATVKVKTMYILTNELPGVSVAPTPSATTPPGITNKEYSYTDAERIAPYWKSNIMRNECITFVQDSKGNIVAKTLFKPKRIICIVDNSLKNEYKEGVDYQWVKGTNEIKWLKGSSIPYFFDGALKGLKEEGGTEYVKNWDGSFDASGRARMSNVLYCVGKFLYEKQVAITYEYDLDDAKDIYHAKYQGATLKNVAKKIADGEQIHIAIYGASNMEGCDVSGFYNREPYCPTIENLIKNYLKSNNIPAKISNIAVGGWNVAQGVNSLKGNTSFVLNGANKTIDATKARKHNQVATSGDIDLFICAYYAGNSIGSGINATQYKAYLKEAIDYVIEKNPDCEILFISGSINQNITVAQAKLYADKVKELQKEYASRSALCDLYKIYEDILAVKEHYVTLSGNNLNAHPNDWLARLTVMDILACFVPDYAGEAEPAPGVTPTPTPTPAPRNWIKSIVSNADGTATITLSDAIPTTGTSWTEIAIFTQEKEITHNRDIYQNKLDRTPGNFAMCPASGIMSATIGPNGQFVYNNFVDGQTYYVYITRCVNSATWDYQSIPYVFTYTAHQATPEPTPAPPTTQPTDTKGPDCITTGPTLGVTPTAPTESATADTVTAEPGGTSDCVEPVQSYTALPIPTQSDAADIPEGGEDFPWVVVGISCGVIIAAIAVLVVVNKKNGNN